MYSLADLSESEDSILVSDSLKRITSIPLHSIRTIELKEQNRLGFKGIIWNEVNLLLRNFILASISCMLLIPFLVPESEWIFWVLVYGIIFLISFVFLLASKRMGHSLTLICADGFYTLQILTDKHWQIFFNRLKNHFSFLQSPPNPMLFTSKTSNLFWSLLWTMSVIGLMGWSLENFSLPGSGLFTLFGAYTCYLFFKLNFLSGNIKVSHEENQLVFLENRGKYKNHRHTIDFNRVDRLSMNANHLVTIHRKTQKELAAETGLENFNHYNRIDYHFLRKNYSLSPNKKGSIHRLQLEAINEWVTRVGTYNKINCKD